MHVTQIDSWMNCSCDRNQQLISDNVVPCPLCTLEHGVTLGNEVENSYIAFIRAHYVEI